MQYFNLLYIIYIYLYRIFLEVSDRSLVYFCTDQPTLSPLSSSALNLHFVLTESLLLCLLQLNICPV